MKGVSYRSFSARAHRANTGLSRPNVCQFELTYRCPLACVHCYCGCYNTPHMHRRELDTAGVIRILRSLKRAGCLWLCLTGGDPLARPDFPELYGCAKRLGFLVSVFTSACSLSSRVLRLWQEQPPFVVEVTLAGSHAAVYERVSRINGSFERAVSAIDALIAANVPIKLKTHLLRDNVDDLAGLRAFARKRGKRLYLSYDTNAQINGDTGVTRHRLLPRQCRRLAALPDQGAEQRCSANAEGNRFFSCSVVAQDGVYVDPAGKMVPCSCIRSPGVDLRSMSVAAARRKISAWLEKVDTSYATECGGCPLRSRCIVCPGRALLETGSMGRKVPYYCAIARELSR